MVPDVNEKGKKMVKIQNLKFHNSLNTTLVQTLRHESISYCLGVNLLSTLEEMSFEFVSSHMLMKMKENLKNPSPPPKKKQRGPRTLAPGLTPTVTF